MFPSLPSVGSIRVYEPYSFSFFSIVFGLLGYSATTSWPPCLPYCENNELHILVTLFSIPSSSSPLVCTMSLPWKEFVEGRDFRLMAWPVCGIWVFSSMAYLLE